MWFNPHKEQFYYKLVRGFYKKYEPGFKNQYDHVVCLVIPIEFKITREKFKVTLIKKVISFLEKFI